MTNAVTSGRWDREDAWSHGTARPNGVDIHYVTAGPKDGDPVLLIHGFPECWYTWHGQIPALADAGYRVVAMDMRGANRSGKPDGAGAYGPEDLAGDAAGLVAYLGHDSARVVGHDFGGLAAWHLAATRPDVVDRLGILNSPNIAVYHEHLRSSLTQLRKAWYVFFFQLPRVPEWSLAHGDYDGVRQLYENGGLADTFTEENVERMTQAAAREGALRGMVNWYRGTRRWYLGRLRRREGFADLSVSAPTLLCWGEQDHALSTALVADHHDVVADLRVERYPEASHWPHFDAREDLNAALLSFL